jgi:hypothetical protein
MTTILVPRINDDIWDFRALSRIWQQSQQAAAVRFDFRKCDFLRQNAVAFLGGLIRLLQARGVPVEIDPATMLPDVRKNLGRNGFLRTFLNDDGWNDGNTIPFREDLEGAPDDYANYLAERWLGRGWIGVSAALRDAIVERVAECYLNAFEHSRSGIGVFTCGQYYPKIQELHLAMVDFGVGIPSNVRLFRSGQAVETLDAARCMQWAFQKGTSTRTCAGGSRGLGLDLLRSFVQAANGSLRILSHDGYGRIDGTGPPAFQTLEHYFEGTLVMIRLKCDTTRYCLASELVPVVDF